MLDIKKLQTEVRKEFDDEKYEKAKKKVKAKLVELDDAKRIVKNFERELEDIYADLGE